MSDAPAATDDEMLIELVGLHAHAMLRMPWVQALLVVGVWLFLHAYVSTTIFLAWGAGTVGVEILRARRAADLLRRLPAVVARREHAVFVALAALSGTAIGAGAVLLLPRLPLLDQALFGGLLFAVPAAGVAVSQSSRYIVGAYAAFMLVPAASTWSWLHPSQSLALAALTLLYCAVLVLVAADGEKLLLRSVSIRHERDRLVRDLEVRNEEVHASRARAEQSAKARSRVLAAASHDLRQPLSALSLYSAVLAANPGPELLREVSQNVDQIVRSLGNLLNGLLDISRLSSGYYVPERQDVAVDKLLQEVCNEFRQPARQKGLSLMLTAPSLHVHTDPVALGRIARNLIDNAIKYTERGSITVAVVPDAANDDSAVLSVTDSGRGIPAAEQARIFEEFYQLDNPGRDRSRGVGLGLAIVQRLCEAIDAQITVDSTPGAGTCFSLRLHGVAQAAATTPSHSPSAATPSLHGRRIYVIDDEADVTHSLHTLFGVWGVNDASAESAEAAEQLFAARGPPELLIVDLRLRGEERGAQLAQRLQRMHGSFPVLIITGETAAEAAREAEECGYPLLYKPVTAEGLRQAILQAFEAQPRSPP